MHRIDTPDAVANLFDEGDPGVPRLPTQVDSEILNAFQEELIAPITQAGISLVKNTNNQLLAALVKLFVARGTAAGSASHAALGADGLLFEGLEPSHIKHGRARLTIRGSGQSEYWITQNAKWVSASSTWSKDGAGDATSLAIRFRGQDDGFGGNGEFSILRHDGATGFADGAWLPYGQSLAAPLIRRMAVVAPTLINSWVNSSGYKSAGYYVDLQGRLNLQGTIGGGTIGTNAFILPAGYRPGATVAFPVSSNGSFGSVAINVSGEVTIVAGSTGFVSLDSISFGV